MNSSELKSMFTHRLRKLTQSGMAPGELALRMQQLLEEERREKLATVDSQEEFMLPFFGRQRAHLVLV